MTRPPLPGEEPRLEIPEWISAIEAESRALAEAARGSLERPTPSCPGWRVGDVVRHLGGVHRWATGQIAEALPQRRRLSERELMSGHPEDAGLLEWFLEGAEALCATLHRADQGLECWTFLRAPSALAFWARRQAHETEVHRADAELGGGRVPGPVPAPLAVDGIEELLFGFCAGDPAAWAGPIPTLGLRPRDAGAGWSVRICGDELSCRRGPSEADCELSGSASELFLFLWNRLPLSSLAVSGDEGVAASWPERFQVRWAEPSP